MKNYFIISLLFIFFFSSAFAQDEKGKNPNVELPEFVITGSDISTVQKGKKIDPELIRILNKQFLKPVYSPEDLKLRELSDPIRNEFSLTDSLNYFTGKLEAKAGFYTLPEVKFSLSSPFENGLFQFIAKGKNRLAYVENSDLYSINGGLNLFYQLESESKILNGTKFQIHGDYGRTSYKLYAANDPFIKRELNKGNINVNIANLLEEKFNYSLSFSDDIHSLQDNVYSENFLNFGAIFRAKFSDVSFGANSAYKVQFFKNDFVKQSTTDFVFIRPFIGYSYNDRLKASVGINYFSFKDESKVYPYLFLGSKISDKISLFAEYSTQFVFRGNGFFLDANPYFYLQNFVNMIYEKKNSLEISLKYDYEKYYELNGGIKYFSSSALPYFEGSALNGRFNVANASAKSYTGFVNLLFHLGPYGYFYGSLEINQTKSNDNKILPYYPLYNFDLIYGYNFNFGLNCELTLNYLSKQYVNRANDDFIKPFVNLGAKFSYNFVDNLDLALELNNLLNRKNYRWYNYQEPPLELTCGLVYRW